MIYLKPAKLKIIILIAIIIIVIIFLSNYFLDIKINPPIFITGSIVTEKGIILENVKNSLSQLDDPSFFRVRKNTGILKGEEIKIIYYPQSDNKTCKNVFIDGLNAKAGEQVEVRALAINENTLSICESKDYYIKILNSNNTSISTDNKSKIVDVFQKFLEAEKACNIDLANSLISEQSKKIMRYNCSSMKAERECYANKVFEIVEKGDDIAVLYFTPFSTNDTWPIFFIKENNQWKINFAKMAGGITMEDGGCNTGWHWRDLDLKDEFCSYFTDGKCPT